MFSGVSQGSEACTDRTDAAVKPRQSKRSRQMIPSALRLVAAVKKSLEG